MVYENGTKALENINFYIDKGEFVFLVGSSAAGKSTIIKLIMRELVPSDGTIIINETNTSFLTHRQIPYFRRKIGVVFQDFRLLQNKNAYDNVAYAMEIVGASRREIRKNVPNVLSQVGLTAKAKMFPSQLSGGEQQRVALARAIVNNPAVLIADEPTGNVDPNMSYEIVSLLTEINNRGTTVLMVTHDHNLVRDFHHRVIMLDGGRIVADNAGGDF